MVVGAGPLRPSKSTGYCAEVAATGSGCTGVVGAYPPDMKSKAEACTGAVAVATGAAVAEPPPRSNKSTVGAGCGAGVGYYTCFC